MALTHDDIQELKKVFDDRYVMQSDCDATQLAINKKFANDDKRIDMLLDRQTTNNWLTSAIVGGIIALLVKVYLGG